MIIDKVGFILEKIEESGYEGYLVGGAVRDYLIGCDNIDDFDICTNMPLEVIADVFSGDKLKLYSSNNTYLLRRDNINAEITPYRSELYSDLKRRDFTINMIAMDIHGKIIDPFGGQTDIKNKVIRTTCDCKDVLSDSPIRILRALRLSVSLGFDIDPMLKKAMNDNAYLLNEIDCQSFRHELDVIMTSSNLSAHIREYFEIFKVLFPGLEATYGFDQRNTKWHHLDVLEHILTVIDNVGDDLLMRYVALFHDMGKPICMTVDELGVGHFHNHWNVSADLAVLNLKRLYYKKEFIKRIEFLIRNHDFPISDDEDNIRLFKQTFKDKHSKERYFIMRRADIIAQNPNMLINRLNELERIRQIIFTQ